MTEKNNTNNGNLTKNNLSISEEEKSLETSKISGEVKKEKKDFKISNKLKESLDKSNINFSNFTNSYEKIKDKNINKNNSVTVGIDNQLTDENNQIYNDFETDNLNYFQYNKENKSLNKEYKFDKDDIDSENKYDDFENNEDNLLRENSNVEDIINYSKITKENYDNHNICIEKNTKQIKKTPLKKKYQDPNISSNNSIKYSFNSKFLINPNKFLDVKKNTSSILGITFPNKTLINKPKQNKQNIKIGNSLEFKNSINKEIIKIMDKMDKVELLKPSCNKTNKRDMTSVNKRSKSFSKTKTNHIKIPSSDNLIPFMEDKLNYSGLNNQNKNFELENKISCSDINQCENKPNFSNSNNNSKVKKNLTEKKSSIKKIEQEKQDYFKNLQKIKSNFENLNNKQNNKILKKNKDIINSNNKFPVSYDNVEENKELVRLLLKNPINMTMEEKIYINSLNNEEFKRFVSYLKVKSKELQWRGNDLGSGHFNELNINISRNTESYLNVIY